MDALRLGKQIGRVVFGQEKMVDDGRDFDPQPLGKLAILNAEIANRLLFLDLLK